MLEDVFQTISHLIPISVTPVGSVTGSIKASCDSTHTVNTVKVSNTSRLTSFLKKCQLSLNVCQLEIKLDLIQCLQSR